jgi:DNA-binding response OmpR family regulator
MSTSPGDGCNVARELIDRQATTVLMATGEYGDLALFSRTGARAGLRKPYDTRHLAAALQTALALQHGFDPGDIPSNVMVSG